MKTQILLVALVLTVAASSFAQSDDRKPTVKYDKFKNITVVTTVLNLTAPVTTDNPAPNLFWIDVMAYYHGRKSVKPDKVFFQVQNRLAGPLLDRELIFLLDGERVRGRFQGYRSPTTSFPFAVFQKIASAKRVEGQAGYTEFELNKEHLVRLRQLAEHFKP